MNLPSHVIDYIKLKCPYPETSPHRKAMLRRLSSVKNGRYWAALERERADFVEYQRPKSIDVKHSYNGKRWYAYLAGDDPIPAKEWLPKGVSRNGSGFRARVSTAGQAVFDQTFDTLSDAAKAYRLNCRLACK